MKIIKTKVDDETYADLVEQRKEAGLPSVSALFLENCGVSDDSKVAAEIVRRAFAAAKKKAPGSEFLLSGLFRKEWKGFSKGARLSAGRLFSSEVSTAILATKSTSGAESASSSI